MNKRQIFVAGALAFVLVAAFATQLMLASAPPAPATSTLPPEKQAQVDAARAFTLSGQPADKSKDPGRPLVSQVDPKAATGMLGAVQAPVYGGIFTTTNAWAGWIDAATYVIVYAGAPSDDATHGLVYWTRRTGSNGFLDPSAEATMQIIPAPALGGPLRITRIDGTDVIVTNPGGREFRFNPLTGAFE